MHENTRNKMQLHATVLVSATSPQALFDNYVLPLPLPSPFALSQHFVG